MPHYSFWCFLFFSSHRQSENDFSPFEFWTIFLDTIASSTSSPRKASTIREEIPSISPLYLDYRSIQSDGEYLASISKQYHSGKTDLSVDNDLGEEDFHKNPLDRGPFFEVSASKNITAIAGHSAYLNCRVRNLGNRTVSFS